MRKLLKPKDILLLTLAHAGDLFEEAKDPLRLVSSAYKNMYGFIPERYKKHNFLQVVSRTLRTGDIEKVVKNGKVYLRLTSAGKSKTKRDFPITNFTKSWSRRWVLVIFDISEKSKSVRNNLRRKLKSLGFGMLQESVWISPLPIGKDMKEVIESIGLSKDAFVMEVSGFLFGDPKELVRKVWQLDKWEEEYIKIRNKLDTVNQLHEKISDRINNREGKLRKRKSYDYELARNKRKAMRSYLEFMVNFPPLPKELLSELLQNVYLKSY